MSKHHTATKRPADPDMPALRRHRQSLLAILLATTALIAAGGLAPARAQNCDPGNTCLYDESGTSGKDGTDGSGDNPGNDGTDGTPGGDILGLQLDNIMDLATDGVTAPLQVTSAGGSGGHGGNGNPGPVDSWRNRGGNGKPGQNGGSIGLTVGPNTSGKSLGSTTPMNAISIWSVGGNGGGGGIATYASDGSSDGFSAGGGNGGTVTLDIGGTWTSTSAAALYATNVGGTGGLGKDTGIGLQPDGTPGGQGGNGGDIDVTLRGTFTGNDYGAYVVSQGGNGGSGGKGYTTVGGQGGDGGDAGHASNATATLASGAEVLATGPGGAALGVVSIGGTGGTGGGGSAAGKAGAGGAAGNATAHLDGTAYTSGLAQSYGVLVQSLGGAGGLGGHSGSWFNPISGDGNTGGAAGNAAIDGTGAVVQTGQSGAAGDNNAAVVAQSIGGGGGVGPDSKDGWFAIGGNGGDGSNGGTASIALQQAKIDTYGFGSTGLLAQSIGGGGGKGGDATKSSGVIVNMVIGGTGGNGGGAGDASAGMGSGGSVTTRGDHAAGIVMQSIGGGGGAGGAGYGSSYSGFYGASISVGGDGGNGGSAGTVNTAGGLVNGGAVVTSGSESFGILGQSIGGGGGTGGASSAKSVAKAGGEYPGFSLALSTGGKGQNAGNGSTVKLSSQGLVATRGGGGIGILGQSIGGGGGTGGDAAGASTVSGGGFNFSASITHGGTGGGGGTGGDVTARNDGLVFTAGEAADGILVQSIGGGGGSGGAGDSKSSTGADKSASTSIALGGSGGSGGQGGNVFATNTGAIATLGDGSHGIAAQTIGGGGGKGGGAAASNSGTVQASVMVGGKGGNGGDTFYRGSDSTVTNQGSIVTFGADAHAIFAQSIGGGGGAGGKAGTSSADAKSNNDGSNGQAPQLDNLFGTIVQDFINGADKAMDGYDNITKLLGTVNQGLGNADTGVGDDGLADAADETAESGGKTDDDNDAKSIAVNVGVGGSGGLGGAGGVMTVNNQGDVATLGKHSDAIVVQSIGGGGGKGGAASTASSGDYSGQISVGGSTNSGDGKKKGVNSDNGGQVFVTNSGQVVTIGALANGIIAQSIGGGGGIGGASTATSTGSDGKKSYALNIALGGNAQGYYGVSESAQVTSSGAIETRGHDSYGIIAQSVAGGGGMVKALATDLDNAGGSASTKSSKDFAANIKLGGTSTNMSRPSGPAIVTTSAGGTITTSGDNSVGILAQSVSAGGGLVQGGKPNGSTAADFMGTGSRTGSVQAGDPSNATRVTVGANITTGGAGSFGVFAQSVGGGGGIAGDLGHTMQKVRINRSGSKQTGNGGDVAVDVSRGAWVTTTGPNAPAIVAQTVGGGGGWFTNNAAAYIGSGGGSGSGGLVTVNVAGVVDAQGAASVGVLAQSTGGADNGGSGTGNQVQINVGSAGDGCDFSNGNNCGAVKGGNGFQDDAAAIYIVDGSQNAASPDTLTNYGYILSHDTNQGTAVYSSGATFNGQNFGQIAGNIHLRNGNITNNGSGTITPYQSIRLGGGTLTNRGTLDLTHKARVTALEGNYDGKGGSRLVHGADFAKGTADRLDISGDASFGGEFTIRPTTLRKGSVEIARVGGDLKLGESAQTVEGTFFTYGVALGGGSVTVTPQAAMRDAAAGMGDNREAIASHLEDLWDAGVRMDHGYAALAGVDAADAAATLDMLSGQALGLIGATRYHASQQFVDGIWSGCDVGAQGRCGWGKWTGSRATMDDDSDAGGYEARSWGFHIGGAQAVADNMTVGGAIGYENLSAEDRTGVGKVDGDSVQLGGFLTWSQGDWRLSGAAEIGHGWFDTDRQIALGGLGGRATGSTDSWHAGLHGRAAWHRAFSWGFVEPRLDVSLLHVRTDGFSESGASPFNLSVGKTSDTTLIVTPGIALGHDVALSGGSTLKLTGSLGYALMSDDAWSPSATLASGVDAFEARTALPDRLLKVGLEAELVTTGNTSFSAAYRGDFGSGYDNHTAEIRVDYRF